MAKDKIYEYSATNASNSDVGGVGILGTNKVSNMDNAVRELMTHLAETNAGTYPVDDTWSFCDPADRTKIFRIDAGSITTATTRILVAPNAAGTLVLNDNTATLTNKTLTDSTTYIQDEADNTKKMQFQLSNLSTATTVTVNAPIGDGIMARHNDLRGRIYGLTLSNGTDATNDIDIAVGRACDNTNNQMIYLSSALTKQLDAAWSAGTNQGGRDTGVIADGTWHIHLIYRPDTDVTDALFSLSATSPTLPANYTRSRRIGSVIRSGGAIKAFTQVGDDFILSTASLDVDVTNLGATATSYAISTPSGIQTTAWLRVRATNASAWQVLVTSLSASDEAPSLNATPLHTLAAGAGTNDTVGFMLVQTNTSSQIRARSNTGSTTLKVATLGWTDRRER